MLLYIQLFQKQNELDNFSLNKENDYYYEYWEDWKDKNLF